MKNQIHKLLIPGIVIHELSHLIAVILMPNIKPEEINITSEIKHSGEYTTYKSLFISYAPLVINSVISFVLIRTGYSLVVNNNVPYMYATPVIFVLGVSVGMSALPSHADSILPMSIMKSQIYNSGIISIPVVLALGSIYTILSLPVIILTYLKEINQYTNLLMSAIFTVGIIYLAFSIDPNVVIKYIAGLFVL